MISSLNSFSFSLYTPQAQVPHTEHNTAFFQTTVQSIRLTLPSSTLGFLGRERTHEHHHIMATVPLIKGDTKQLKHVGPTTENIPLFLTSVYRLCTVVIPGCYMQHKFKAVLKALFLCLLDYKSTAASE